MENTIILRTLKTLSSSKMFKRKHLLTSVKCHHILTMDHCCHICFHTVENKLKILLTVQTHNSTSITAGSHSSALPTILHIITCSSTFLICGIHQLYVAQPDGISTFSTLPESNRIVNRKTTVNIKYTKCTCHTYSLCSQHT